MESSLIARNIIANHGRTSIRLESAFWDALADICNRERLSEAEIVVAAREAFPAGTRTSAVRTYVMQYFRNITLEAGREMVAKKHNG